MESRDGEGRLEVSLALLEKSANVEHARPCVKLVKPNRS